MISLHFLDPLKGVSVSKQFVQVPFSTPFGTVYELLVVFVDLFL